MTPQTFVASDVLAADELNILGDDIEYLKGVTDGVSFSGVQVRRAASQSIANNTDVEVSFDTQNFDIGSWWASGTDVIVPAGAIPSGFTVIGCTATASVKFAANGTGTRRAQIHKNGTQFASWTVSAIAGETTDIMLPDAVTIEASDVITLVVKQTSGGARAPGPKVTRAAPSPVRARGNDE